MFFAGHAGARNCKFLEKVTVTDTACKGDSNWKQYAVHAPDVPIEKIAEFNEYKEELMADPPVQEMPVQSMITSPGMSIQATTVIVDTVIVESTAIVEQKTLTTQFYLLLVESPL